MVANDLAATGRHLGLRIDADEPLRGRMWTNADNWQLDEPTNLFYAGIRVITQLIEYNDEHA